MKSVKIIQYYSSILFIRVLSQQPHGSHAFKLRYEAIVYDGFKRIRVGDIVTDSCHRDLSSITDKEWKEQHRWQGVSTSISTRHLDKGDSATAPEAPKRVKNPKFLHGGMWPRQQPVLRLH